MNPWAIAVVVAVGLFTVYALLESYARRTRAFPVSVFRAAGFSPRGFSRFDLLRMPVDPAYESENRSSQERVLRKVFAYVYQTKERLILLSALQDHRSEVQRRLDWMEPRQLEDIELGLAKESLALAGLSYLTIERRVECVRTQMYPNVAIQKEDRAALDSILESLCGSDYRRYRVHLDDETMIPIVSCLKSLTEQVRDRTTR